MDVFEITKLEPEIVVKEKSLTAGSDYEFIVRSKAEKTGFVNATNPDGSALSSDSVYFFAYTYNAVNETTKAPLRIYDMSHINSVLLPQSDTDYYIWIGAKQTTTFNIVVSGAFSLVSGIAATMLGVFALVF